MADQFTHFNLPVLKEINFPTTPHNIIPCASGGFLVKHRNSALVSRFDANYNLIWEKEMGDHLNNFNLTISPDDSMIGVNGIDFVRIYDNNGQLLFNHTHFLLEIYESSDCYFHADDNGKVSHFLFFEPSGSGDGEGFLRIFDAVNFSIIKSLPWRDMDNHFVFYPTPDPSRILINLLAGQDGSQLLLAMLVDNNVYIAEQDQCSNLSIGSFSPTSDEFVAIENGDQCLIIYSFPDMEQIATQEFEQIFSDDHFCPGLKADKFEYTSYYLSPKIIMVRTLFGRLLMVNRDSLQCIGELVLERCAIIGYDYYGKRTSKLNEIVVYESEAEQVFLISNGDLLVIHANGKIHVYKLPPILLVGNYLKE